jgi:hypothetical protein
MENVLSINFKYGFSILTGKIRFLVSWKLSRFIWVFECMRDEAASFIFFKKIKIQRTARPEVARRNDEAMTVVSCPNFG